MEQELSNLKPSHFCTFPWESILCKTEAEVVAVNIMKIRRRLGDKWKLTWSQYKEERQKDGHFSEREKEYFDKVLPLIKDASGAISFSKSWLEAASKVVL